MYRVSCTMVITRMNSITRKGKLDQGVTDNSSYYPPPGIKIMQVLEMTDGV
jgi:hypothetical protein